MLFHNENAESDSDVITVKCRKKYESSNEKYYMDLGRRFQTQAKGYFNTPSYLAWAFQSGSPLKHDFDRVILRLTEVGLLVCFVCEPNIPISQLYD